MNKEEIKALAVAWAERYKQQFTVDASNVIQKQDINWPAWEQLHALTHDDPQEALKVVFAIARSTDNEWVLENLGAGPLEDLIHYHGSAVISAVESEAASSPSFVQALACVWESGEESVWARVQLIVECSEHNKPLKNDGRFLRFGGHPELTLQECHRCQDPDPERRTSTARDSRRLRFD